MTILIKQSVPERSSTQINTTVAVEISAQEARRKVDRWLLEHISTMLGADEPILRTGTQTVWSVPVCFGAPHTGRVGQAGTIEVDALSGKLLNLVESKAEIEARLQILVDSLPPFHVRSTPDEYLVKDLAFTHPVPPPSGSPLDLFDPETQKIDS